MIDQQYRVHVGEFEGPLDLLLHLARTHEVEIRQLPLAQITGEYLEMLQFLKTIDLEPASEFLEVAASLLRLKAQALLPSRSVTTDEDMAAAEEALLQQLVEHQVVRMAAQDLRSREAQAAAIWFRGDQRPGGVEVDRAEVVEADLFALVGAFRELLDGLEPSPLLTVDRVHYPVAEQVEEIRRRLAAGPPVRFRELFGKGTPRRKMIAIFLALLEVIRSGDVRAFQETSFGEIMVFPSAAMAGAET
ncbi:MAG: segregation and condensation protein A [Acidobacteriota bacterium]